MRLVELHQLYGSHADGCDCGGCLNLTDDEVFDVRFKKISADVHDDFLKQIWDKKLDATTLHEPLFQEHFSRLRNGAMAGYGRYFSKPGSLEEHSLFQSANRNAARFAAAKQQSMIEEIRDLRTDAAGNPRPKAEWERLARGVMSRHNGQYLKAEIGAAQASGSAMEQWQEIQKRKLLYPNLRYETVGDSRVRDEHRAIDGAVYPVDHPFWDTHFPPNGWRCRCIVVQTDQAENRLEPEKEPAKGFRHNPGKTGELFSEDHPYFSRAKDRERLWEKADLMRERLGREEVKTWMEENVISKAKYFNLPDRPDRLIITNRDVKNVLAHPHKDGPEKNELLYALALALKKAVLLAERPNVDALKNQTISWLYYMVEFGDNRFVLNLEKLRMEEGNIKIRLYAIKDGYK